MQNRLKYILGVIFCLTAIQALPQSSIESKPVIDSAAVTDWPKLGPCKISPYGNYIYYGIANPAQKITTFKVLGTKTSWEKEYVNLSEFFFADNERIAVLRKNDELHFLELGNNSFEKIISVKAVKQPRMKPGKWIAYTEKNNVDELILLNLLIGSQTKMGKVNSFMFNESGSLLLLEKVDLTGSTKRSIQLLDLENGRLTTIWTGLINDNAYNYVFSASGNQIAFMVKAKSGMQTIWIYNKKSGEAKPLISDDDNKFHGRQHLMEGLNFSKTGKWLFFNTEILPSMDTVPVRKSAVMVDIWNYNDSVIKPNQSLHPPRNFFRCVMNTEGGFFRQFDYGRERLLDDDESVQANHAIVERSFKGSYTDNSYLGPHYYEVIKLDDSVAANRIPLFPSLLQHEFSPDGKWLVYYDQIKGNYFSYNLSNHTIHNLTGKIRSDFIANYQGEMQKSPAGRIAGWLKGTNMVMIYDNYDIWTVDMSGESLPINLTRGYGKQHGEVLRLVEDGKLQAPLFSVGDTLTLVALNLKNNYNGFLRQILTRNSKPEILTMGPYVYYRTSSQTQGYTFDNGMIPLKALHANLWIVKRQSASDAPNYFLTENLKDFKQITYLSPQKKYNWLSAELLRYKQLDGTIGQGILYKPENFDPRRKYPVIFNYYEKLSHRLFEFPKPQLMNGDIDIAWLVSRGYLVFTPDIIVKPAISTGQTASQYAFNALVSAANSLSKRPYVDVKHLGIQGHSFGGMMTNYIITHTHLFAAASEMAGVSDLISAYLNLKFSPSGSNEEQEENMYIYEAGQIRIGATLWQTPQYFENQSAIFRADKIKTPLLIVHNKLDESVQWRQGIEMYLAMRRLKKPCWFLQYDGEHHILTQTRNKMDYTIRLTQFFDHYLKEAPPPKWMTEGINAWEKGKKTGYELDISGRKP